MNYAEERIEFHLLEAVDNLVIAFELLSAGLNPRFRFATAEKHLRIAFSDE